MGLYTRTCENGTKDIVVTPTTKIAIPTNEIGLPTKHLLNLMSETREGLFKQALIQLSTHGTQSTIEEYFHDRVLGDEGIGYSDAVVKLYQEYNKYIEELIATLCKYLNKHPMYFKLTYHKLIDTLYVVECQYDTCHTPE